MSCTWCPMANRRNSQWDAIVALIQEYALEKYRQPAKAITIHLHYGDAHREPLPPTQLRIPFGEPAATRGPPACAGGWASGDEPKHLSDFQQVYWPGLGAFTLTPKQAKVVEALWDAWEGGGSPEVSQVALLAAAESDCARLLDLFRNRGKAHPAWGRLVLPGEGAATFRLPELPSGENEGFEEAS